MVELFKTRVSPVALETVMVAVTVSPTFMVALGIETAEMTGTVPSTKTEVVVPTLFKVRVALLPVLSWMVSPLREMEPTVTPSVS